MLGSECSHSFNIFICDVGGDDQDGGVGVTQLIGAVYFTDNPALIGKALLKHDSKLLHVLTDKRAVSKESNPRI